MTYRKAPEEFLYKTKDLLRITSHLAGESVMEVNTVHVEYHGTDKCPTKVTSIQTIDAVYQIIVKEHF